MFAARYDQLQLQRHTPQLILPLIQQGQIGGDGSYQSWKAPKNTYSANFIEQRARLQYIAKANADLKLVTQFELDYTYWGNSSYTTGRNQGGAIGADTVNIETKNIYLDANPSQTST